MARTILLQTFGDYKLFEVQEFMTVSNYSTGPDPFIVDLNFYESLSPDLRKTFDQGCGRDNRTLGQTEPGGPRRNISPAWRAKWMWSTWGLKRFGRFAV